MRNTLFSLIAAGLLGTITAQAQWSYHGLGGLTLHELRIEEEILYAATAGGLFRKDALRPDTTWSLLGLNGKNVRTLAVIHPDTILAVVHVEVEGRTHHHDIYRTFDSGGEWSLVAQNLGEEDLFKVLRHLPNDLNAVVAGGFHGIWKSVDLGTTWIKTAPASDVHFITFDPTRPEVAWSGGESNILWPYLMSSTDSGDSWSWVSLDFGGDNAVYDMAIDPATPEVRYLGAEGFVVKSEDGSQWRRILEPQTHEYFLGLEIGPSDRSRLYASGIRNTHEPQRPVLYVSNDFGESWAAVAHGDAKERFGVVSLGVAKSEGHDTVFLGTWRDGVYAYSAPVDTGAEGEPPMGFRLAQNYPNPFNPSTSITFEIENAGRARLRIYDVAGRLVETILDEFLVSGSYHVEWNAAGMPAGVYMYCIEVSGRSLSREMVLLP